MATYELFSEKTGRSYQIDFDTAPSEADVDEAVRYFDSQAPQDSGQGYASSLAASAARGAARIVADIPGGIGYLTGSETLVRAAEDIESSINEALPVNPAYADDFAMKAANAIGQGFSMLATGAVGGAAGRALGAVRTGAEVASMGAAFLGGARGGGQEADRYGMEGVPAYLRILGGGATEYATERFLFGLGDETRAVRNVMGDTVEGAAPWSLLGQTVEGMDLNPLVRGSLTEGAEEFTAGVAGNALTAALAPAGVQTPGLFQGGLENFLLGSVAGGVLGGAQMLTAPAAEPLKTEVDGQLVLRGEDGVLYKFVPPATPDDLPLQPIDPEQEPLLAAKAEQQFAESTPAPAEPEPFTVEAAETAATQPPADDTALPPTETPPAPAAAGPLEPTTPLVDESPVEGEVTAAEAPQPAAPQPAAPQPAAPQPAAPQPSMVGISNRRVDEERKRLGMETVYEPLRQTFGQWWESAMRQVDANPAAGAELVSSVVSAPRVLSAEESALLAHEQATRTNAYESALTTYNASPSPEAEARLTAARERLSQVYEASDLSGTRAGQALVARRIMAARDFSLARMDMERRAANGGELTPEQQAQTVELHNQIADLQRQLSEYQAAANDAAAQTYFKQLVKELGTESRKQKRQGKTLTEFLDEAAERARQRIRERGGNLNVGLNPMDLTDRAIVGASYIARGLRDFTEWSGRMLQEFGEAVRPYLDRIFNEAQTLHDTEQQVFTAPARTDTRPAMEQIAKNAAAQQPLPPRLVYALIKEKVKAGARTLTEAVQQATADLQAVYPGITERQVRDEFSGYGRVKFPSQEAINKRLSELRRIAQLTSAIEDVQNREPPKRSGLQRDKATQQVRDMQRELTRLMQENGIERTTAADQLKTSLDGIKSRLRNQIEDLNKQIETGEKRKRKARPEYDAEARGLRDRRDELKKIADAMEGPVELTPEQRIERAVAALERNIEELERRIRERDFSDPEMEVPQTQHLQVLRDERDALREQYNQLKIEALGAPQLTEEQLNERAVAQLNRAIEKLEEQLRTGDFSRPSAPRAQQTPELRSLQTKLRALREQRDALKKRRLPTTEERLAAAEKALEKAVDDLNRRIDAGDTSSRSQQPAADNARTRALRAERDSLREVLNRMKREQAALKRDPVAEQLKRDKDSLRRRIRDLEEKIATRDFAPPEPRERATDRERQNLEIQLERLQTNWANLVFEERLANRSPGAKMVDFGAQALNTARAILTSLDFSAVLRQGGFIVLGNPARGAKSLAPMFRAFGSRDAAEREMKDLQARENYPLYKQAKLFLSDVGNTNKLTQQEEAFMSRWLEKIPRALGGGLLRGSQRAYTVFLNRLRADSFDAMLASLQNGSQPTPAEAQEVANFINVATGRGDLGKANQAAVGLNTVFFAPRLVASRFQLLYGQPFFRASPRVKRLVLREYAKFLTGVGLVYALGMLAQDEDDEPLQTDPRSSDFGKLRFGNTRVDPLSGLSQVTVLLSRLATGEKKTASGKVVPIRGDVPYGGATSFSVLADFTRSKFSPAFGSAVNLVQGRNVVGEETDLASEAQRMLIPMSFSEAAETMEEQGVPRGTAFTLLSLFGMGVQTYDPTAKR